MGNTKEFAVSKDVEITISDEDNIVVTSRNPVEIKELYNSYQIDYIIDFADLVIQNNSIVKNKENNHINNIIIISDNKINILCKKGSDMIFFKRLIENIKDIEYSRAFGDEEVIYENKKLLSIKIQTLN
ncbi:hypothetical protein EJM73_08690 [Clostridium botulinum]|uniref:hypothetical protein n=1 Tax=Clostridium botulinum TaxID=1491 RepID=UPI001375AA6F|nr:hypothetical protein [Clostridium botulinum]NCI19700.1 hypothetical protein [Clostridium botulinum]NCI35738.1 hypothetical protein [Clostridium botulinum]NCI71595.1 hypothetical protein [Clostridium botulinum]NDI38787.1 hypothetical protein [Clostridium botulinum]